MICHKRHVCLTGPPNRSVFGYNPAEKLMIVFTQGFLVRAVGFTEKDFCAFSTKNRALHPIDVGEFLSIVRQDDGEAGSKQFFPKGSF